jgi:DNA-binding transcriptional LysR family regulator
MIILPLEHRFAGRASLSPADLADEDFIVREEGSMTRAVLEAAFAGAGVALRRKLVLGSRETIKVAVAARMGLGAVFENEFIAHADGVAVPLVPQPLGHGVYAVTLKESADIPAVAAFVERCRDFAGHRLR